MSAVPNAVAYHRAGHAVAAIDLGVGFRHLTIGPEPDDPATCPFVPRGTRVLTDADRGLRARYINQLAARIVVAHAGPLAEANLTGINDPTRAAPDVATAHAHLAQMIGFAADTDELDELLRNRATNLITNPRTWSRIERIADLLGASGRMTRAAVLAAAPPPPARRRRTGPSRPDPRNSNHPATTN